MKKNNYKQSGGDKSLSTYPACTELIVAFVDSLLNVSPICILGGGGGGSVFGSCFDMHILVSFRSFEIILMRTSDSWLLCFNCFLVS